MIGKADLPTINSTAAKESFEQKYVFLVAIYSDANS
jgi:hypothetical protein